MPDDTQPISPADLPSTAINQVIAEYQLAKKALRWMLEHQVLWSWRMDGLVRPVSMATTPLTAEPSVEILAFIHGLAREIELDAESAG